VKGRFTIEDAAIADIKILTRHPVADARGFLDRLFSADELGAVMGARQIRQINRTRTIRRGTVRGMHYQLPPHSETKLVSCLKGSVYDVAVDVREGSPTFLEWHGEVLSETRPASLLIPEGFAHGFQSLSDDCELLYLHTATYEPEAEAGLNPRDPRLAIQWPEEVTVISARDDSHPMLTQDFNGIVD
jgi:dTDP-4-dehydrorhamnose 3,5-epimerase